MLANLLSATAVISNLIPGGVSVGLWVKVCKRCAYVSIKTKAIQQKKVFIRKEALRSPYDDAYDDEPKKKRRVGSALSHDTFMKKKPFAQLLKALKSSDTEKVKTEDGGSQLPFFMPVLVAGEGGEKEEEENLANKSIEEQQEMNNKFLDSIYGGEKTVLGEMEAPENLRSTLHPHQKQV